MRLRMLIMEYRMPLNLNLDALSRAASIPVAGAASQKVKENDVFTSSFGYRVPETDDLLGYGAELRPRSADRHPRLRSSRNSVHVMSLLPINTTRYPLPPSITTTFTEASAPIPTNPFLPPLSPIINLLSDIMTPPIPPPRTHKSAFVQKITFEAAKDPEAWKKSLDAQLEEVNALHHARPPVASERVRRPDMHHRDSSRTYLDLPQQAFSSGLAYDTLLSTSDMMLSPSFGFDEDNLLRASSAFAGLTSASTTASPSCQPQQQQQQQKKKKKKTQDNHVADSLASAISGVKSISPQEFEFDFTVPSASSSSRGLSGFSNQSHVVSDSIAINQYRPFMKPVRGVRIGQPEHLSPSLTHLERPSLVLT
ncbi:hypothetical protein FRC05_009038 [Tulasnella sp. 425]|nr:hypothetical protein FRC05_009038 [Tulasnella sp. 425]